MSKSLTQAKLVITPRGLGFKKFEKKIEQTFARNSITGIDDSIQQVLLAIQRNEEEKKELGVDASDALERVHENVMSYISGNLSIFEANQNILECTKIIRKNPGHLQTILQNLVSEKRIYVPVFSIAGMTLSTLFNNYVKILGNLQSAATSSCIGALVAGTSFQEIYNNLPVGSSSWFDYASYLITITNEVPTLNKAVMIENGLRAVSTILSGVKAGSSIKNLQTMTQQLQALDLGFIKPEDISTLQLGYQEMNTVSTPSMISGIIETVRSNLETTIAETQRTFFGNVIANEGSLAVQKVKHFTEQNTLKLSQSIDIFQGLFGQMRDIGFSIKNVFYVIIAIFVVLFIYILVNHLLKCRRKKDKNGFVTAIQMLFSKKGSDQLELQFKSTKSPKKSSTKSTKSTTK